MGPQGRSLGMPLDQFTDSAYSKLAEVQVPMIY